MSGTAASNETATTRKRITAMFLSGNRLSLRRFGRAATLALLFVVPACAVLNIAAPAAVAKAPQVSLLTVKLNGPDPLFVELGVERFQDPGVTVAGGTAPYSAVEVVGSVDDTRLGTYSRTYVVRDAGGQVAVVTRTVIVQDTIAPVVDAAAAVRSLWPPNHNLINVGLSARVTDAGDPSPEVSVSVFADEDDDEQTGDGRHSPDAKGIAPAPTLRLRAERKGNADGRVYLIVVTATDESGNVGYDAVTVVVPHDKSKKSIASVNAQAQAAEARVEEFVSFLSGDSGLPSGFFVIGDGPVLGPKQ